MFHQACGSTHATPVGCSGHGDACREAVCRFASLRPRAGYKSRVLHLEQKASSSAKGSLTRTFQAKKHVLKNHVAWHAGRTTAQNPARCSNNFGKRAVPFSVGTVKWSKLCMWQVMS